MLLLIAVSCCWEMVQHVWQQPSSRELGVQVEKLKAEAAAQQADVARLHGTTVQPLYQQDLDAFLEAYEAWEADEAANSGAECRPSQSCCVTHRQPHVNVTYPQTAPFTATSLAWFKAAQDDLLRAECQLSVSKSDAWPTQLLSSRDLSHHDLKLLQMACSARCTQCCAESNTCCCAIVDGDSDMHVFDCSQVE